MQGKQQRHPGEAQPPVLPMSREEMRALGWDQIDILLVTGDAYVDHPAFGAALLGRWLCAHGFRVGIVAQPRWDSCADVQRMGRPRLFAGVTAGSLDSMLAHYTAFRKKRHDDAYTPGGRAGARPNRATIVYTGLVRQAFPGLPVAIGGVEASMRRAAHYDFWSDSIRRSILLDSKADILVYGMAERALLEIARRLRDRLAAKQEENPRTLRQALRGVCGTAVAGGADLLADLPAVPWQLPSFEAILSEPRKLMDATLALERQVHDGAAWAVQATGDRLALFTPPAAALSSDEMDAVYALPFSRRPHPVYKETIPAVEMIQFSVTTHRGCGGGCTFCSLAFHQGRRISSRSRGSILGEVARMTEHRDWKGSLTDVGGPSANMWGAGCLLKAEVRCRRPSCLHPRICRHFEVKQPALVKLLRDMRRQAGVRHLRTASGVRFDLALLDPAYMSALVGEFTGGQLKLAPEHCAGPVLERMRKPGFDVFERFLSIFERESKKAGKEQYVVPYLLSAFPGCSDADMRELSDWLRRRGWRPQQVQCFVPTPGTVATAMYCAGIDAGGNPIHVARTDAERLRQHAILTGGAREKNMGLSRTAPASGRPPAWGRGRRAGNPAR